MLDQIDIKILDLLQHDGRLPVTEIAEKVGLSATPCQRRIRRLEETGVVRSYAALLNQKAVNLPINAFIFITLEKKSADCIEEFEKRIRELPGIMECYLMTGGEDYLVRVVAPDLEWYERFMKKDLTRIPGIKDVKSSFAVTQAVSRTALPLGFVQAG